MKRLFEYLRLTLFVAGVLIGIQVPSFVDQYGQRLESHMLESTRALQDFQTDANAYFDGDIQKLIEHYRANRDPIINDGGNNISTLYARNQYLVSAYQAFSANQFSPYLQTFLQPVSEIRAQALASYDFTVMLNRDAIIAGLAAGLILGLLLELFFGLLRLIFVRPERPRRPVRRH